MPVEAACTTAPWDGLPGRTVRPHVLGPRPDWDAARESRDDEDEWRWAAHDLAPDIARSLGAGPLDIGAGTPSRGTGVIALTPYGVAHGVPADAHRVRAAGLRRPAPARLSVNVSGIVRDP
ncbi:hypothetical protein [Streptomyces sp. NPDC059466]|uniref:hypothetical protein n=1 Tax=unclassified Streptomyces TaxID=2593676 RepID=UPI0036C318FD